MYMLLIIILGHTGTSQSTIPMAALETCQEAKRLVLHESDAKHLSTSSESYSRPSGYPTYKEAYCIKVK